MRIVGTGIDIVEIDRIRKLYRRYPSRFIERVYTAQERVRIQKLTDPAPYLSGRWAVKEAVLKALGTGLSRGISWRDISVVREPSGAPRVFLYRAALQRARDLKIGKILVSLSHGRDLAVAQAIGIEDDGVNDIEGPASDAPAS